MSLSTKILLILGSLLTVGALSFIVYKQIEISQRQLAIEEQVVKQKELIDGIVRSQNEYTTKKDMEQFIKDNGLNLKAIQDDLGKLHADIVATNVITTRSKGQIADNLPSTNTEPGNNTHTPTVNCNGQEISCPNADPFDYMKNKQKLSLNENFNNIKVPIGEVGFSAWQQNPWSLNLFPREYNVVSVVGTDEDQRHYFYNKFTIKVDNKDYDIKINSALTKEVFPESKFRWFDPRLYVGLDSGANINQVKGAFTPSLNVQLMSLGKYKNQPDLSFLQLGIGFDTVSQKGQAMVTPAAYNIGQHIPLMNNTYVGPSLHIGFTGDLSIMGGLRVGL